LLELGVCVHSSIIVKLDKNCVNIKGKIGAIPNQWDGSFVLGESYAKNHLCHVRFVGRVH
jgi:hypothetical protein